MKLIKKIFGGSEKPFSAKLEELDYFKYSANRERETLKKRIDENYKKNQILSTPKDENYRPIDLRYYFCDGEAIHEQNGYERFVEYIKPTLEQLEIYDELKTTIPDSGKRDTHVDSVYNLIKKMNKILDANGINENWYPIYGGNDGQLILLTSNQFKFLSESIKDAKSRPFEIEIWRKLVLYKKSESSNTSPKSGLNSTQGDKINHSKFGLGVIKEVNEKGVALIKFEEHGERKIIMKYAKYEIVK